MRSSLVLVFGIVLLALSTNAEEIAGINAVLLENYMFDTYNQSTKVLSRAGAVVGVKGDTSDTYTIYVLSGANASGNVVTNYQLDVNSRTWTPLNVNFSRSGACYSQDTNVAGIWIFGGLTGGTQNTDPFTYFSFSSNSFSPRPSPPASISLTGAACAAAPDGSKFYVLSVAETEFEDEANCSASLAVFDGKNWTVQPTNGTGPSRVGSSAFYYGGSLVVYGGKCGADYFGDVYRLDLSSFNWKKDASVGEGPVASNVAAFVQADTLFVVGGQTSSGESFEAFAYDLVHFNWTAINSSNPEGRYSASVAPMTNRAFIIGGQVDANTYLDDVVQLVLQAPCTSYQCEDCTNTEGCGWCIASRTCLAGGQFNPFIAATCNSTDQYINDLDSCPQVFPSYGIALLVIGGVVVVGIIIFAIMKVRSGDEKEGYERIS